MDAGNAASHGRNVDKQRNPRIMLASRSESVSVFLDKKIQSHDIPHLRSAEGLCCMVDAQGIHHSDR